MDALRRSVHGQEEHESQAAKPAHKTTARTHRKGLHVVHPRSGRAEKRRKSA
jgi:hypothetical protein